MSKQSERIYRSLRGLEKTASTSRVLNLAAIAVKYAGDPEHAKEPLFNANNLGAGVIIKHRLRVDELENFDDLVRTATKLIIPFDRANLALGGRALFVGEINWMERLADLRGSVDGLQRDAEVLEAIDELPSLDPFLLREHLKRRGYSISPSHFEISQGDSDRMQKFVGGEIARLIQLAYNDEGVGAGNITKLVEALLSSKTDERLEPLRLTLRLEGEAYREGIFSWKGFLYYKWVLNTLWPNLKEVLTELAKVRVVGARDAAFISAIEETRTRLRESVQSQVRSVMGYLKMYDAVFEKLTSEGNAGAFRDFLLQSPDMFVMLGEGTGTLSHIATFWRYRFPKGKPLTASMGELFDILQDFESSLGTEPHLSKAA
ncbi:MAG: hypothetical protein ACREE0_21360 [Phenylobacterium sp.]